MHRQLQQRGSTCFADGVFGLTVDGDMGLWLDFRCPGYSLMPTAVQAMAFSNPNETLPF